MSENSMSPYQRKLRTEEVFKAWGKELGNLKAVPLLCIAGVTGDNGKFPIATHFTINSQGRTAQEVLELLKNTVAAMEAQMQ